MLFKRDATTNFRPPSLKNDSLEDTLTEQQSHFYKTEEEERQVSLAKTDLANFAPLYERYFPRIYSYCLRRVGQPQQAEDLTSLIFTRALAGLPTYTRGSFAAWLFRIAHNTLANHRRSLRPQLSLSLEAAIAGSEPEWLADDSSENMLGNVLAGEQQAQLGWLIGKLSEEQQELLALSVMGRMSAREVGQVLGKSEGAVRMALRRTIQQLKANNQQWQATQKQEDSGQ